MTIQEKYNKATAEYIRRLGFNNLSQRTITNYDKTLRLFGDWLAAQENKEDTDLYESVEEWRDEMTGRGVSPSTVRQYLTTLKIFFDRASKRSFPTALRFSENPVDTDLFPKVVKRPYDEILTDEQVVMLYKNEAPRHFPLWPRNYAMLCLLLNEKIRNAELLDLTMADLDFQYHELTIQSGKGRKFRVVDMCELTEEAVKQYLNSGLRPSDISDNEYLFGTTAAHEKGVVNSRSGVEKWHRGSSSWLSGIVERTVYAITGTHDVRSHDLRHVGSRLCLNAGQSAEELQGQLGHSQITTTAIYSGRLLQRRRRDSAKSVLAARDAAAKKLRQENEKRKEVMLA